MKLEQQTKVGQILKSIQQKKTTPLALTTTKGAKLKETKCEE
jgi:hypothetical protein